MEEWKDIIGFDNYQISNYGNVRNNSTNRILKQTIDKNGYVRLGLRFNNKGNKSFCT